MSDNIIIKITAESDSTEAVQDLEKLKQKEKEILSVMDDLKKKQNDFQGAPKVVALLDAEYKKLSKDLTDTKKSITEYGKGLSSVNDQMADNAVKAPRLVTQLRAIKQELAKMEMDGISPSSKAFVDLSIKAGQLEDQIGDTRQRVSILASDTKNLDAAMSVGTGLAGAFNVATSAAALLGGENEELQKAFLKVQASLAILNGVQEVANVLNKDSVAMVVIGTAVNESSTIAKIKNAGATKLQSINTAIETGLTSTSTVARGAATAAQWLLNAATTAFPFIALIAGVTAIIAAYASFSASSRESAKEQIRLNNAVGNFNADMTERERLTKNNLDLMKAQGATSEKLRAYEKQRATDDIKYYEQQYYYLSRNGKASKEQIEKALNDFSDSQTRLRDIKDRYRVEDAQAATDAEKKQSEQQKTANEKRLTELKAQHEKEVQLEKEKQTRILAIRKELNEGKFDYEIKQNNKKNEEIAESDMAHAESVKTFEDKVAADITKNQEKAIKDRLKADAEAEEKKKQLREASVMALQEIGNILFDSNREKLTQEQNDLNQFYTTDAEEAKKNKNKKLISEEEMAKRQLEIKRKQAKIDKEQAMFNIFINTALAVIAALTSVPPNVPLSIANGIVGAASLAAVAAKPLPKYAKGKQAGGKGHFATVGEFGAEQMWIPDGAAIIPHNRRMNLDTFSDFGIPTDIDSRLMRNGEIDYNKLGRAVADNVKIPTPKPVTVNVDKNGVSVSHLSNNSTFLNKKYTGSW